MPHVIVEYTEGLASDQQIESLLDELHAAIAAAGLFDASHIRIRAHPLRHYRCGGTHKPFIHAQLRIHSGRNGEQKLRLSGAVSAALQRQQWAAGDITVEVVEMEPESYAKFSRA